MIKFIKNTTLIITCLLLLNNCTKEVDFNQIDDANIRTEYIITLMYFNLTAPDFLDDADQEILFTPDIVRTPIAKDSEPYLEKVEIDVITENSFDRDFNIEFTFYDENNTPIYTIEPIVDVLANSAEKTITLEIPTEDIHFLYETSYIGSEITLLPSADGSVISIYDASHLILKSSLKLFFNYHTK